MDNKWRATLHKYRQNLSHKAERIQMLWARLQQRDDAACWQELRHICHQLAGSGTIYGFPEVTRLAQALQLQFRQTDLSADQRPISTLITALLTELTLASPDHSSGFQTSLPAAVTQHVNPRHKIVFVDDDQDLIQYHSAKLQAAGFEVIPVTEITLLATAVQQHQPLAAICDMAFPEGATAGADYLVDLRKAQGVQFPVLFISAFDNFDNRLAAVRAGSSHFMAKPVSSKTLINVLNTLLKKAEVDPYRVMLVDDDPDVLRFYRHVLQLAGYKIFCCDTAKQALAVMLQQQPELVLIDLHMQDCHGLELGQIVRQHSELIDTPLVFMSGDESLDEQLAAVRLAGDEFVHKPIATWRLLMIVEARVKRSRLLRQQKRQLMLQPELVHRLDTLTALPTLWQLQKDIEQYQRSHKSFYLFKLDLNKFHLVNDVHGHQTGDLLLQTVAWKLMQQLTSTDQLYRQNGDEFWLLTEHQTSTLAYRLAERLLNCLSQSQGTLIEQLNLTASIGLTQSETFLESAELLMQQANIALHQAKRQSGFQIQGFNTAMQSDLSRRYQLQQDIRTALNEKHFSPVYQPIVNSQGEICSLELLSRWQHPQYGYISPEVFIPLLEEENLICHLTSLMLQRGLEQLKRWRQQRRSLKLNMNFSAADFADTTLAERLATLMQTYQLPPSALTIEITESILLDNSEHLATQLANLKSLGFMIALDDFGTGYSSLSYLNSFPVDILKIDRSFVSKLAEPKTARLTSAIIHLAQELHLDITAEGVETATQFALLKQEGCLHYQGYYFSKPLVADDMTEHLLRDLNKVEKAALPLSSVLPEQPANR